MKQWSMFIGRWQPWHEGHQWLIAQRLNEGKNVWIAIRDVEKLSVSYTHLTLPTTPYV